MWQSFCFCFEWLLLRQTTIAKLIENEKLKRSEKKHRKLSIDSHMIKYSPNTNAVNCTKMCSNGQLLSSKMSNEQNPLLRIWFFFFHFSNHFIFSLVVQPLASWNIQVFVFDENHKRLRELQLLLLWNFENVKHSASLFEVFSVNIVSNTFRSRCIRSITNRKLLEFVLGKLIILESRTWNGICILIISQKVIWASGSIQKFEGKYPFFVLIISVGGRFSNLYFTTLLFFLTKSRSCLFPLTNGETWMHKTFHQSKQCQTDFINNSKTFEELKSAMHVWWQCFHSTNRNIKSFIFRSMDFKRLQPMIDRPKRIKLIFKK